MNLGREIVNYIRAGESDGRGLGLEVEHFVVDGNGWPMGFDEITALIDEVARDLGARIAYTDGYPVGYFTDGYSVSLEPSCQFEISIDPYSDIDEIRDTYNRFIALWEPLLAKKGYSLVTKGNLPIVELGQITPDEIPLSPKKRYKYMDAYFKESGKYGEYMMRASTSVQVSIDFSSEEDMVRKLRVIQKISPVLMIIMENKSSETSELVKGSGKIHLHRTQEWDALDPERTGFFPGTFDEDFGYESIAQTIIHTPLILLTKDGETKGVGHSNALDLVEQGVLDEINDKLIEHIISMGFFHCRVKRFIEIRVADSVSIDKALGYVALIKGLVYNYESLLALEEKLSGISTEAELQGVVEAIERDGFEAKIYDGRTAYEWYKDLVELAGEGLTEKDREYLKNV